MHALVRVPALTRKGRASKAERYREPNLIEEFAITAPATHIVEPSLKLEKNAHGPQTPPSRTCSETGTTATEGERWDQPL
jgi:hypothetical protein